MDNFFVSLWSERDRNNLTINVKTEDGITISVLDYWDDDVISLVKNGFIDPSHLTESCVNYAKNLGVI